MRLRKSMFSLLIGVAIAAAGLGATGSAAYADSATGPNGQRLNVSPASNLARSGQSLSVSGSGYDETKGIYVAQCIDKGPGVVPSPCAGGTTSGDSSRWVSNSPDGAGLAIPYQPGGSFSFTLKVSATFKVGSTTYDCATVKCAIVTRADHTRLSDRTQDVRVPLTFPAAVPDAPPPPPAATPKPAATTSAPKTSAPAATEPAVTPTAEPSATPSPMVTTSAIVEALPVNNSSSNTPLWAITAAVILAGAAGGIWWWRKRNSTQEDAAE